MNKLIKRIMGVNEKTELQLLEEEGYEDSGERYSGLMIFQRGRHRALYDKDNDAIITRYDIQSLDPDDPRYIEDSERWTGP